MADPHIKLSRRMKRLLLALLTDAPNLSGYPLAKLVGHAAGGLYVDLYRLENAGFIYGTWEERDDDKPRRRFYRLTPDGWEWAREVLSLERPGADRG